MSYRSLLIVLILVLIQNVSFGQMETEQDLIQKLQTTSSTEDKIEILLELGLFFMPYDYSKALHYLQEGKSLAISSKNELAIADADYLSSRVYYYQDEYHIAKSYLEKALKGYQNTGHTSGIADYYFALGEIESLYGNYVKAIEAYQTALELEIKTEDQRGISILLNSLAGLHREQGNLDLAMDYTRQSLSLKIILNDSAGIGTCFTSLGSIFEKKEFLDSAEYYFNKGLNIREHIKDYRRIASSNYHLGRLLNHKKDPSAALVHLDQAYKQFNDYEDKTGLIIVMLEKSKAYRTLYKIEKSQKLVDKAHALALETENKNLIKDTYKLISEHFINNANYKEGYEYYRMYQSLEDSIHDWRKEQLIEELELSYKSKLKDNEIINLKTTNQLQQKNNIILWLSLITLLIGSSFIYYLYRIKTQNLRQNEKLLEKEKIIHEKDYIMQESKKISLERELESKNRELGAKILSMLRTNEMQDNLVQRLSKLTKYIGKDKNALKELNAMIRELENHSAQNLWKEFDKTFQSIHSEFYERLLGINADLTPSEIKLAAFLKLNLSTKEIAALTFKTESGIKSTRHRLRKKLKLSSNDNLVNFLIKL